MPEEGDAQRGKDLSCFSGQHEMGPETDPEGSVREERGSGSTVLLREGGRQEGQSHSPVQEQQGCPHPPSDFCQHHLQLQIANTHPHRIGEEQPWAAWLVVM